MATPAQQDAARRQIFARRMGEDLRQFREASGVSLAFVADIFGWHRTAMSKIERGDRPISIYDYLTLMDFYGDLEPNHPAFGLAKRFIPPATQKGRS